MKRIGTLLLVFGLTALGARAQTVTGSGTTNTIPKFTGSSTIGDSVIVESNGKIGIGTTTAQFPLHVFGGFGGPSPRTEPISILGELRDSTDAASAVEGLASTTSGFTNCVCSYPLCFITLPLLCAFQKSQALWNQASAASFAKTPRCGWAR